MTKTSQRKRTIVAEYFTGVRLFYEVQLSGLAGIEVVLPLIQESLV